MKTFSLAICALACVAGCARNGTVLLERDLRMQEDRIYQLQCMLEDCQASREAAARENAALKQQLETGDRGAGPDSVPADIRGPSLDTPEPSRGSRPRTRPEVPKLEVPSIELPEASDSPPAETTPNPPSSSIRRVQPTQIVINKKLTGGLDRDGRNGDDGLLVVLEPRDAAGNLVDASGPVSVVLIDPTQQGERARLARWNFAPDEVKGHYKKTIFGRGLQFELPWPGEPPQNSALRLYVRFTTADGQKLNAEMPIDVRPPLATAKAENATKSWSATTSAARPQRRPTTRVKQSAPKLSVPNDRASDAEPSPNADQADHGSSADEPLEQAARPVWKPYR